MTNMMSGTGGRDADTLRITYPGGRMVICLRQFFPASAGDKKKLLDVIRESYEDSAEWHGQILSFLRRLEADMMDEKENTQDQLIVFREKARGTRAYQGVLPALERQIRHFERMEAGFRKDRLWWEEHIGR